jgi:hypothetical protein
MYDLMLYILFIFIDLFFIFIRLVLCFVITGWRYGCIDVGLICCYEVGIGWMLALGACMDGLFLYIKFI